MSAAQHYSYTTFVDDADPLVYTGAIVPDGDGVNHYVIDVEKTDFSRAPLGRKRNPTLVIKAKGGEHTAQVFKYSRETQYPYIAQPGEAIFLQGDIEAGLHFMNTGEIPDNHGTIDCYVPDNATCTPGGNRLLFANLADEGYEVLPEDPQNPGTHVVSPSAPTLHMANKVPACIMYPGAAVKFFPVNSSFKKLGGAVSGINPEAFLATWALQSPLFLGESFLKNRDGVPCRILNTAKVDFTHAVLGRKKVPTFVVKAKGGENLATILTEGHLRTFPAKAKKGDAIFVQGNVPAALRYMETGQYDLEDGPIDVYVPNNATQNKDNNISLKFDKLAAEGYEVLPQDPAKPGTFVLSRPALVLPNANDIPMCIVYDHSDSNGQAEFFLPGATLKWLGGHVSGISRSVFGQSWEIIERPNAQQQALRASLIAEFRKGFFPG